MSSNADGVGVGQIIALLSLVLAYVGLAIAMILNVEFMDFAARHLLLTIGGVLLVSSLFFEICAYIFMTVYARDVRLLDSTRPFAPKWTWVLPS